MRSPDQGRELLGLVEDVGGHRRALGGAEALPVAQDLGVGAQAGDRGAQLMRGIGHQVALRGQRSGERGLGGLEAVEHRVEAPAHAPDLVLPGGRDAPSEVPGALDVLGHLGELGDRRHHRAREEPAERGGEGGAGRQEEHQDESQPGERGVHALQRAPELHGPVEGKGNRDHPQVHAAHPAVGEERARSPPSGGHVAPLDRDGLPVLQRAPEGLPVGREELGVAGRAAQAGRRTGDARRDAAGRQRQAVHHRGLRAQGIVHLPAQLAAHDDVADECGDQHGDADRRRGHELEPAAQGHGGDQSSRRM